MLPLRPLGEAFRLVAPDLPGFGHSDAPTRPWGTGEYAEAMAELMERMGAPAPLLGHSFGGRIALRVAVERPQLVRRLVLVATPGVRLVSWRTRLRRLMYRALRPLPWSRRLGSPDWRRAGPLRSTLVRVVEEDLSGLLPRVGAPVLLVWGERDREVPLRVGQAMGQRLPQARLLVFPRAGHFCYLERLAQFCEAVEEFLREE